MHVYKFKIVSQKKTKRKLEEKHIFKKVKQQHKKKSLLMLEKNVKYLSLIY